MGDLNTPPLSGSINRLIDDALMSCHIGMPARVLSYDASQQRVGVQPIIRRSVIGEDGVRTAELLPPIEGVPVIFPGAGSYKITFPIDAGDIVWLLFGEGSLDKWLDTAAADVDVDDDRRNALSDAVAIPGILPFGAPTDQVDSGAMVLSAPAIKLGSKDASDPVALKSDLQEIYDAISDAATAVNDGGATFKAAIITALDIALFPVASTKVNAE